MMTTSKLEDLQAADASSQMQTYARAPIAFVKGEGVHLIDQEGQRYLDLLSGIAVTSLGHCHPAVTSAISEQASKLDHVSNLYLTEPQVLLAQRLVQLAGFDARVFFANSGAEANECALKLARRVSVQRHGHVRSKVVALKQSFHGRTFATLAATGQPGKHEPFAPLPDWFVHVAPDNASAMHAAIDDDTAAVLIEVVQGEGGVYPVPDAVLEAAREGCDRTGAVLIFDEIQTGIGRLGSWFGYQTTPVQPDIFTLAKALANGLPIGACVARSDIAGAFAPGDHATTFGGGPIPCAAGIAVLDTIEEQELLGRVADLAELMRSTVTASDLPLVSSVRGRGLLQGIVLNSPVAAAVVDQARARGVIIGSAGHDVVRLAPPLIIAEDELERGLQAVIGSLKEVS